MKRPILIGAMLVLVALVLSAAEAPAGFPTGEILWGAVMFVLGIAVPYLLGKLGFSTWQNRALKTIVGWIISAMVALLAVLVARVTSGHWPFNLDFTGLTGIGLVWVQFCYNAFVKSWLEKQHLTR